MEKREVFGTFVAEKRRAVGLSQRDLADSLHITESAVSKWERGVSYPDITMIAPLARALGVSDHELMSASEDHEYAQTVAYAKTYRTQRRVIIWGLSAAYLVTLVTCLIVNLAVNHALTGVFIVAASLLLAACLTLLPYWVGKKRWPIILGAFVVSLYLLLFTVWVFTGGGWWILTTVVGVLFGVILVFGPLLLRALAPVGWLCDNKALVCAGVDTVLLFALVAVAMLPDRISQYGTLAVPIILLSLIPVWAVLLIVRYVGWSGWYRAGLSLLIVGVWYFFFDSAMTALIDHTRLTLWERFNLLQWGTSDLINSNVRVLTLLGLIAAALVTALIGYARRRPVRENSLSS